jgi:hypothetical protein
MPVLYCRHLDKRTQWKVSTGESFTLGFSSAASVPIPDGALAPREAIVSHSGDRYVVRDLAEKGRVLLNGVVVREALLQDGDRLQVGRIAMLFLDDARVRGGELDLYPGEAEPETEGKRWETLEAEGDRAPRPAGPPPAGEGRKRARIACFLAALAAGLAIGLLVRVPGAPDRARDTATKTAALQSAGGDERPGGGGAEARPGAEGGEATRPPAGRDPGGDATLRKLEEIRREEREDAEPPPPPPEPGAPARASARLDAAGAALAGKPSPDGVASTALAAMGRSRLALFRLFLDVAGRPPTRGEEEALLAAPHEERCERAREAALREGSPAELPSSAAALFQLWIGRPPSAGEIRDLEGATSRDRPAACRVSSLPEYSSPERRRPRSVRQRARSLIVDLLDRPPAGSEEIDLVEAALREPRALEDVSRTLIHSSESRLADAPGACWESEFFRFLLRPPGAEERAGIERLIEGLPPGEARRRLALALVSFPEYRSY